MYLSTRWASSAGASSGPDFSFRPRNSTICLVLWPKVNLSPRDRTGTERTPSRCNSAMPPGSSTTFTETKSIPRTDRNSLSLRQLVQPGCQNTLNGGMEHSCNPERSLRPPPDANNASRAYQIRAARIRYVRRALLLRLVADHADLGAVEIAHIAGVVVGMIVRAQAGLAFVVAAGRHHGGIGGVDRFAVRCFQADRDAVAHGRRLLVERPHDPELRTAAGETVARRLGIVGVAHHAERLAERVVEALGLGDVVAADRDVTEHGSLAG